jgi:serine/threonine protein kinase
VVSSSDGGEAFLKVFDFSEARNAPDEAIMLQGMINSYVYERDLLKRCGRKGLDRVVRAMDSGKIDSASVPGGMIFYLVFERADADARALMDEMRNLNLAWRIRTLHQVTVGLHQLHTVMIAHQDVKPSNVLSFGASGAKLGDLGRACAMEALAPHADNTIAGDPAYAPPELQYKSVDPDWRARRLGCDLYLLGSMAVYLFTSQAWTHLLLNELPENLRPLAWGDPYLGVLPFLRQAHVRVLEIFSSHVSNGKLREALLPAVDHLCDPDPSLRGHPPNRGPHRNQYCLLHYMSLFDRLARQAEVGIL